LGTTAIWQKVRLLNCFAAVPHDAMVLPPPPPPPHSLRRECERAVRVTLPFTLQSVPITATVQVV
jgi:hypothetical protein